MNRFLASKSRYDVIIVGLGPTGATLAGLLGQQGVSTLVLDREGDAYHLPRAVHFDDEVMRVFQTVGIADAIEKQCHVNPGMKFVATDGSVLLDWPRPLERTQQAWHASYRFHQPELESQLRAALGRFERVEVGTLCDVDRLAEAEDGCALISFEDGRNGTRHTVSGRYVVGCDGANSFVHDRIGGGMHDFGFEERWLVIDAILTRPKPELGDYSIQYCDPTRPVTYVRGTGNRRRWEITVQDEEESSEVLRSEAVWRLLSRWVAPDDAELERTAVYTFKSRLANHWRKGPLIVAGDAAHLTPPFMGQGMCAGIRDVSNLAWKLALCVSGRGSDGLLDTYQSERAPHAQEYLETAIRLGRLINQVDTEAALRMAIPTSVETARMNSIAPRLGPGLTAGDATHRGLLGWQLTGDDGLKLDEQAGYRFILITTPELAEATARLAGLLVVRSDQIQAARDYLAQLDTRAVMLRPDRYILGTARTHAELASLLTTFQMITGSA